MSSVVTELEILFRSKYVKLDWILKDAKNSFNIKTLYLVVRDMIHEHVTKLSKTEAKIVRSSTNIFLSI